MSLWHFLAFLPPLTSVQIGLGFMQFGFVAIYLSESFVRGFMTAAGLQILISVLKYIFGIKVPPYSGPLAVIYVSDFFILWSKKRNNKIKRL